MISESKEDNERKFIISFFCGDDTIQVYQNSERNSGIWGGKFLERKKIQKDDEQRYITETDFQIGAIIKLGSFTFQLLKADEFTLKYMKERPELFPQVSVTAIVNKITSLAQQHQKYEDFLIWILKSTIFVIQTSIPKINNFLVTMSFIKTCPKLLELLILKLMSFSKNALTIVRTYYQSNLCISIWEVPDLKMFNVFNN